jgi:hypothetical protein
MGGTFSKAHFREEVDRLSKIPSGFAEISSNKEAH